MKKMGDLFCVVPWLLGMCAWEGFWKPEEDLPEMFLERGLVFTHEAVREWEAQLAPLLSETLRKHRRGRIGPSWYVDETFRSCWRNALNR